MLRLALRRNGALLDDGRQSSDLAQMLISCVARATTTIGTSMLCVRSSVRIVIEENGKNEESETHATNDNACDERQSGAEVAAAVAHSHRVSRRAASAAAS